MANRFFKLAGLLLFLSSAALAESSEHRDAYDGHGYLFYGLTATNDEFEGMHAFGGGGEALVYEGLGLGGELGYTFPQYGFEYGFGLASANASYHFVDRVEPRRFAPIVTGGYSVAFRGGALNLINYGAGANVWSSDRTGLRFEIRNYQHPQWGQFQLARRLGLTFR